MPQQPKNTTWINLNTVITSLCTAALIWVGNGQVKMYNAIQMQPKIDEVQTNSINILVSDLKELKADHEKTKNDQTRLGGRVSLLEALLPDPKQFKISK